MNVALLYHDVVEPGRESTSGFRGADADKYKLTTDRFVAQLEAIGALGLRGVRVDDPGDRDPAVAGPPRGVVLTFDDGGASAPAIAELLDERGHTGYFFITTDRIGSDGFVTDRDVAELHARGHVIGSHSASHPLIFSTLSPADMKREWDRSLERLSEIVGTRPTTASIPGGYYSRAVAESAVAAGIRCLFTSAPVASPWHVGACVVRGRFNVDVTTPTHEVTDLARGRIAPRARQFLVWNAKKLAKRVGGAQYVRLRKALIARRAGRDPH